MAVTEIKICGWWLPSIGGKRKTIGCPQVSSRRYAEYAADLMSKEAEKRRFRGKKAAERWFCAGFGVRPKEKSEQNQEVVDFWRSVF
jgi:hypothetical protein